jgi:hypothetical protein
MGRSQALGMPSAYAGGMSRVWVDEYASWSRRDVDTTYDVRRMQDWAALNGAQPVELTWSDAVTPSGMQGRDQRTRVTAQRMADRTGLDVGMLESALRQLDRP